MKVKEISGCWHKSFMDTMQEVRYYAFYDVKRCGRGEIASYGKPLKGGWDI